MPHHLLTSLSRDDHASAGAGAGGAVYGMGFLGAVIYYIQAATSFWSGVLGVLKALFWPGFLVYELLKMVGA
jgi:hypothetical protein